MPFTAQDKMKKVLDLWSKNSTFPPLMLAKLKGLVNGVDSPAQGAYFEHLFPVLPIYSTTCEIASRVVDLTPVDCLYAIKRHLVHTAHLSISS